MSPIVSVSQSDIQRRRSQLRNQRRWKLVQGMWRTIAVGGIAAGVVWGTTLPIWIIQEPEQVVIEGEEVLTEEIIRSLLPLSYPQALVKVRPQDISKHLEAQAPIADATVIRHVFPPRLVVQIQERHPVALLISSNHPDAVPPLPGDSALASTSASSSSPLELLDEKGFRMSFENYVMLNKEAKLPELRVIGLQEQYRAQWEEMYQYMLRSPVKIFEVDWREPTNLILKTELGVVYIGPYSANLPTQFRVLDQMRQVPEQLNGRGIDYIDLTNPAEPLLELSSVGDGDSTQLFLEGGTSASLDSASDL